MDEAARMEENGTKCVEAQYRKSCAVWLQDT